MPVIETDLPTDEKPRLSANGSNGKATEIPLPVDERSRKPAYAVAAIILVSLVIGLGWWFYARQFVTTDDAFIEGNVTIVSPKISAHVSKIHVRENQFVKKGELLLEFDQQELEARLNQSRAQLQAAFANREKAAAQMMLTRQTGRANLNQADSNLRAAKSGVEQTRMASIAKRGGVEQARRQAETAQASIRQAEAQIPGAEAALAQSRAQVSAARTKLERLRLEHERDRELFGAGDVSRQKVEQSRQELSEAEAGLVSAEKQVDIAAGRIDALRRQADVETARLRETQAGISVAESDYRQSLAQVDLVASQADESAGRFQGANVLPQRVAVEESEIGAAEAQVAQALAAVAQAELELGFTKIYAPQDGFIARKNVQEGQLVQPEHSLMAVMQPEIWVVANFKETQIERIRAGQAVDIYVDAYPGARFRGKIDSFQPGTGSRFSLLPADNASGNFVKVVQRIPVKIIFEESPDTQKYLLVPGMSVVPRIKVK